MCTLCFDLTVKYSAPENIFPSWSKTNLILRWTAVENFPAEAQVRYRRMISANVTEPWTDVSRVSTALNLGRFFFFFTLMVIFILILFYFLLQWRANTTSDTSTRERSLNLHHVLWFCGWVTGRCVISKTLKWICEPAVFLSLEPLKHMGFCCSG